MNHIFRVFLHALNVTIKVILFILSFALQMGMIWLSIFAIPRLYPIYIASVFISLIPIVHVYNSSNNSSFKMSWIILIFGFPIAGTILYIFFGQGRNFSRRDAKKLNNYLKQYSNVLPKSQDTFDDITSQKIANLLHFTSKMPFYQDDQVKFIKDGEPWFEDMLQEIGKAKKYIFLEYFILSDGDALSRLIELLLIKAAEGVEVKLMLDDVGSKKCLKQKTINRLKNHENIEVCSFNPMGLFFSMNLNFRNHRKMTIVDGKVAYCGGLNIADEYIHKKEKFGFWRDNANKYFGKTVNSFIFLFCIDWFVSTKEELNMNTYFIDDFKQTDSHNYCCPFSDGPGKDDNPGYTLFRTLIENAKKTIYISTPYFIINREFIADLENAARSGVEVKLLIPHIPDKKTIFIMTYYHIGRLIKSGVKVYRYTPGFNHAKNIIIDDQYSFNGTFNLDYRSLFLHFECGVFHINESLNATMKQDFLDAISISEEITYEKWKKRGLFTRILEFVGSLIAPLL